jgi:ferric-dicitrate binding protein FerR (iron transport regulator)
MNCTECKNLVERYLDGIIEASELEALKQHVRDCPECRKEFEAISNVGSMLKDAFGAETDAIQAKESVLSKIASGQVKAGRTTLRPLVSVSRWASVAAGIALAAGIVLGLGLSRVGGPRYATADKALQVPIEISSLEGTVLVKHSNLQTWEELKPEAKVYLGDVFHSAAKSDVVLRFEDGSTIALNANSTLSLKLYNGGTEFYLEYGVLAAALNSPHPPFFISTPHGRVEALGTEFTVSVE